MRDSSHGGELAPARRRLSWTMTLMLVIGGLIGSTAIVAANHDPGGRNGTIKVDDEGTGDDIHPNNEPHVTCAFHIDAYGFDSPSTGELRFYAWPPTGNRTEIVSARSTIALTNENHGGSERGYDGRSRTYTFADMTPGQTDVHRNGLHVKVIFTAADGARKTKVFWVEPCPGYPYP